jgi:hypothetical protein
VNHANTLNSTGHKVGGDKEGEGNTNVGGRTDKTLTVAEGRVRRWGEEESPEVDGSLRQSTKEDERRKPEEA